MDIRLKFSAVQQRKSSLAGGAYQQNLRTLEHVGNKKINAGNSEYKSRAVESRESGSLRDRDKLR